MVVWAATPSLNASIHKWTGFYCYSLLLLGISVDMHQLNSVSFKSNYQSLQILIPWFVIKLVMSYVGGSSPASCLFLGLVGKPSPKNFFQVHQRLSLAHQWYLQQRKGKRQYFICSTFTTTTINTSKILLKKRKKK